MIIMISQNLFQIALNPSENEITLKNWRKN